MLKIENEGPRLSDVDIADFERKIKARLPEAYRRFLSVYNGGRPTPATVDIKNLPGGGETDLDILFGLGREPESSDISWNLETLGDRIPEGLLPIGSDSGGSIFCLALAGRQLNKILYWDAANSFYTAPEDTGRVFEVAPDFESFLGKLRDLT
jgi:hypothetical protein